MPHPKLMSLVTMLVVFGSVGAIAWAILSSHGTPQVPVQEQVRDVAMLFVRENHPETAQFMANFQWTGGRVESGLLGAETYLYQCQGWKVTLNFPVIENPVYEITAEYAPNGISLPYAVSWSGNWTSGSIAETSYSFAE